MTAFTFCSEYPTTQLNSFSSLSKPLQQIQSTMPTTNQGHQQEEHHTEILHPLSSDILCGRFKDSFNHTGNQRFRAILREKIATYASCSTRTDKSALILQLTRDFRQKERSRFIKKSQGRWIELDESEARKKVGHALRDMYAAQQDLCKQDSSHQGLYQPSTQTKQNMESFSFQVQETPSSSLASRKPYVFACAAPDNITTSAEFNAMFEPLPLNETSSFQMSHIGAMEELLIDDPSWETSRTATLAKGCKVDNYHDKDLFSDLESLFDTN